MKKKKQKGICWSDVPQEVQKAWAIEHIGKTVGIGMQLLKEYEAIKERYPEYFKEKKP